MVNLAVLGQGGGWQIGFTLVAGTFGEVRAAGVEPLQALLRRRVPWLGDRVDLLTDVNQLTLLPIRITRVDPWSEPGLLLIGDAAHVISPVGGNGINFAIVDAAEAANRLVGPLTGAPVDAAAVERGQGVASASAPTRAARPSSASSAVRVSGGAMRSTLPCNPPLPIRTPRRRAASSTAVASSGAGSPGVPVPGRTS